MRRVVVRALFLLVVGWVPLALAGCGTLVPRQVPSTAFSAEKAVIPGIPNARVWGDEAPANVLATIDARLPNLKRMAQAAKLVDGRPQVYILALSGGGSHGAFGAGLLKGWAEQGSRPRFDLVTGVSAGALIAPFAFLGPEWDPAVERVWTEFQTNELVVAQILPGILGGSALADTTPLQQLIEQYVDRRFLRLVAAEYAKGRLLLIGTTNLDAQRPVFWNMGEIAASRAPNALDLFRKVLLASAAIPGAFPPVSIEVETEGRLVEEMHVDGGTTRDVFVAPGRLQLTALDRLYPVPPKRHIYVIINGRISPDFEPVKPTAVAIGARAISTLIKSHDRDDLALIATQARASGADFRMAALGSDFEAKPTQIFDPVYQRQLYEYARRLARDGNPWRPTLPPAGPAAVQAYERGR